MIEIYYNHKLMQLSTEPPLLEDWEKWNLINNYSGATELPKLIELFKDEPFMENMVLWNNNIEIIMKDLILEVKLVEAAGGIVKNSSGQYLFIKRLGKWDLPKGKIEKGESVKETATREIEEECGIENLKLGDELSATYHFYIEKDIFVLKKSYWFNVTYAGEDMSLVPQLNENITEAKWVNTADFAELKENTYPSILSVLKEINL
jgi:8-oxo-dGTP pyrophosphatase MutT (NUDIX family)